MAIDPKQDGDLAVESLPKEALKRPILYKVLFHNDHYTTMEFVVAVLKDVFHKSDSEATAVMLHVHRSGYGVAGLYTREIAETKITKTLQLAKEFEFPLRLTMEPEEV